MEYYFIVRSNEWDIFIVIFLCFINIVSNVKKKKYKIKLLVL